MTFEMKLLLDNSQQRLILIFLSNYFDTFDHFSICIVIQASHNAHFIWRQRLLFQILRMGFLKILFSRLADNCFCYWARSSAEHCLVHKIQLWLCPSNVGQQAFLTNLFCSNSCLSDHAFILYFTSRHWTSVRIRL